MQKATARWKLIVFAAGLVVALVVAMNWQGILFGLAVASSETRPVLLSDARWDEPGSARQFNSRFAAGTPERDLLAWLRANDFTVNEQSKRADRRIKAVVCNERIRVTWNTGPSDSLTAASALVREGGCL
jgi:hypothetical protein